VRTEFLFVVLKVWLCGHNFFHILPFCSGPFWTTIYTGGVSNRI